MLKKKKVPALQMNSLHLPPTSALADGR